MKAVGYVRVSTEEQAAHGISLDAQRARIEAYATAHGLELVEVIEDAGRSGKNLKRPGLQHVLRMAAKKEVDAVIIMRLDRAFRNVDDARAITRDYDRDGVALHSIDEKLDTKSAMGRFFFTLMASIAEMERDIISERITIALQRKRARGERYGEIPYGFACQDGKLIKCEEEQKALSRIKRLRKQGLSFQKIADALNTASVPTRHGRPWTRVWVDRLARTKGLVES